MFGLQWILGGIHYGKWKLFRTNLWQMEILGPKLKKVKN